MSTTRLCLGAVETYGETEVRSYFGPIVDGRSVWPFARQKRGDVTQCDFDLFLARYGRWPFSLLCRCVWYCFIFIMDDRLTRAHKDRVPLPNRDTENAPMSAS
eukprot:6210375-Pleurochrysis_carterae.AAC.1